MEERNCLIRDLSVILENAILLWFHDLLTTILMLQNIF